MMVCSATARANVFCASKPVDCKIEVRLHRCLVIGYRRARTSKRCLNEGTLCGVRDYPSRLVAELQYLVVDVASSNLVHA